MIEFHELVRALNNVRDYLPSNFIAVGFTDDIRVVGFDNAGWTLDGYVIPRLASGLIPAEEIERGDV